MAAPVSRRVLALVALLATWWAECVPAQDMREYHAKGAFILNVLAFVDWPETALAPGHPIEVAVVGRPSGEEVQAALAGKTARRRPLVVRVFDRAEDVTNSHVLFLTADARGDVRGALRKVTGKSVLTIVDGTADTSLPSIITLLIVDARLAFTVDLDAADANGVRPATQLLRLAKRVRGRGVAAER